MDNRAWQLSFIVNHVDGSERDGSIPYHMNGGAIEDHIIDLMADPLVSSLVITLVVVKGE